jgi:pepsin A
MVPKTLLLLAALRTAQADSSHELFYKTVDPKTHLGRTALVGRGLAGTESPAVNEQVSTFTSTRPVVAKAHYIKGFWFSRFAIGDSPDLEILIDTGSSDAILNPGIYKPSPNAVNAKRPFHISYATTNHDGTGDLSVRTPPSAS